MKEKGEKLLSNKNLKNKSIDELREMLSKGEAELKVLHNKSKYYESQINLLTRKERTHRLCTRGAMLEKFLGCPNELVRVFITDSTNKLLTAVKHTLFQAIINN